jgi:hypothetical protein
MCRARLLPIEPEHGSLSLSELNRYVRTLHEKRMRTSSVAANNYGCH